MAGTRAFWHVASGDCKRSNPLFHISGPSVVSFHGDGDRFLKFHQELIPVFSFFFLLPMLFAFQNVGQILHFDCALVVLMTLRRSIGWLRQKRMDWLLPLDRHVYFHKLIGWLICAFSLLHTVAHLINYGTTRRKNHFPSLSLRR